MEFVPISLLIIICMNTDLYCYSLAKEGKHEATGWPNTAYGVSKVGVTAMCMVQQRQFDAQKKDDVIVNAVGLQFYRNSNVKVYGYIVCKPFFFFF